MPNQEFISLNLQDFVNGDQQQKDRFVEQLGRACNEIGFIALSGHYLDEALQARIYQQAQAYFSLPQALKDDYRRPDWHSQRGYSGQGEETAKGHSTADLKEFWQHGQDHNRIGMHNLAVSQCPDLLPTCQEAYRQLERTGAALLQAIALYLGEDQSYFAPRIEGGESILRCIHYPPITQAPKNAVRAAAHEDINLITLLMGASAAGLEVLRLDGQWIPITALPNQLVVNIGDMLQRLSNGVLVSTTHRVVNPPEEEWGHSRFSIPFFLHPKPEVSLASLAQTISAERPKRFDDISAGDYLAERLREIQGKK